MNTHNTQLDPADIPLNAMDKMFYSWEYFGYTAMVRTVFELSGGHVDIALLRQAYAFEVKRWPVLNATIVENKSGQGWDLRWVPRSAADPQQTVRLCDLSDMPDDTAEIRIRELQFDPFTGFSSRRNPPLFMILCRLPGRRAKLLIFIHHAVTDASGIELILKELFTAYNHLAAGQAFDHDECRSFTAPPALLLPRSRTRRFIHVLEVLACFAAQCIKSAGRPPTKILYGKNTFSGKTFAVFREISTEQLTRFLRAAKRHGAGLNTFLATAQISALDSWKRGHGESAGMISSQIHTSLPTAAGDPENISNRFSTHIIHSYPRHRADLATLLQHVRKQHDTALRRGSAEKLLSLLWLIDSCIGAKTLKLWGNFFFNNPRIGDSTQVTNLGRLWAGPDNTMLITQLGDAQITACYMAGPPVPSIGSYSAFLTFNNRLYYTFNYFDWAMTDADACRFVALFEKALGDLIECEPCSIGLAEKNQKSTAAQKMQYYGK